MDGRLSPSLTRWTRRPLSERVVGFWPWLVPEPDAVEAFSAWASSRSTVARIGSPLGWKRTYWMVRLTGTDFGRSTDPQRNVTNGGAEPPPPPPPSVSIIFSSLLAVSLTLWSGARRDTSSSRLSVVRRGRPPPNSPSGRSVPVVGLKFQMLVFETV